MRSLAVVALAAGALSLCACDSVRQSALPEKPVWVNRASWAMSVVSRRSLTTEANKIGEDWEKGQPAIDAKHNRIFVGSADRGFYALRAEDLSTLWRFQTLGVVQCEPLYDPVENVVYFGSNDGALYKVRAVDGELMWRFATSSEVSRRPVLDPETGVLFVVNANDTVVAVDSATGQMRWSQHRTPAYGMEIAGYAGPTLWGGRVYTAFSDGRVFAFEAATGKERWSVDLAVEAEAASGEAAKYLDVDTTPIVARTDAGMTVFVASYAGGVFALDADTGSRVWANEKVRGVTELTLWDEPAHAPRGGGPAVPRRRMLLAASGTTGLWSVELEGGRDLWRRSLPEGGVSQPVAVAGAVMVSTTRYGLFLFSPIDGSVIDGIASDTGFAMTPGAFGRRAFAMSNTGVLLGIHVDGPSRTPR
jgi:outer membrane protein assembly factor BamB